MSTIDQTIQTLFNKLNERKNKVKELKEAGSKAWKTNGTFRLIGAATPVNITTANQDQVSEMAVHLSLFETGAIGAATRFGQPAEVAKDMKVQGYKLDDWFADLAKRLATINLREEEKQLEQLEVRLNSVLSPDERRRIEVEMLAKELG